MSPCVQCTYPCTSRPLYALGAIAHIGSSSHSSPTMALHIARRPPMQVLASVAVVQKSSMKPGNLVVAVDNHVLHASAELKPWLSMWVLNPGRITRQTDGRGSAPEDVFKEPKMARRS